MRKRLTQDMRRTEILAHARAVFLNLGYGTAEMEDLRKAAGLSRGGLYHHFANKAAILEALVEQETQHLIEAWQETEHHPIVGLLEMGSGYLRGVPGILQAVQTHQDKAHYLACLDQAYSDLLSPVLAETLSGWVTEDTNAAHVAELFLTINTHINRRSIFGDWTKEMAAAFSATALGALKPLFIQNDQFDQVIQQFATAGDAP